MEGVNIVFPLFESVQKGGNNLSSSPFPNYFSYKMFGQFFSHNLRTFVKDASCRTK